MQRQSLSRGKEILYAFGMMGWSILINLIGVILTYFYLPPADSGLPAMITQLAVIGAFNVVSLVLPAGRLIDAMYDPLVAQWSDRSKNPKGRRIPIMKLAIVPSVLFSFLVFYPPIHSQSGWNILWLTIMLAGFYISTTTYSIPYNALLPELAHTPADKVRLASWQSAGYVFGIAISSNTFNIAEMMRTWFGITEKIAALQCAVLFMSVLGGLFMLVTALSIDEKKYSHSRPSTVDLLPAIRQTLGNKNFRFFVVADFSYFMAVTIITSGLMYFVKVLLGLDERVGNKLMITMVLVSFVFYPVVNFLSGRITKKSMVVFSFLLLGAIFSGIFFLGRFTLDPATQIFTLIAVAAIPVATLNILPNAILSEVIENDSRETGQNKEAIFFAVRYFFVKIAQSFGIALFSMLLTFGKDSGNDFGIRLNGLLGLVLCVCAALVFLRFKEQRNEGG